MSYVSFDMNVEKVEDIAGIFPIFFIVVAALVALTSMTKMVEEDRMQIGTLKALGYNEGTKCPNTSSIVRWRASSAWWWASCSASR